MTRLKIRSELELRKKAFLDNQKKPEQGSLWRKVVERNISSKKLSFDSIDTASCSIRKKYGT